MFYKDAHFKLEIGYLGKLLELKQVQNMLYMLLIYLRAIIKAEAFVN